MLTFDEDITIMSPEELEAYKVRLIRQTMTESRKRVHNHRQRLARVNQLSQRALFITASGDLPEDKMSKLETIINELLGNNDGQVSSTTESGTTANAEGRAEPTSA
jgi:predicted Co/Zn/Cd cation transporter (cation efflux family)